MSGFFLIVLVATREVESVLMEVILEAVTKDFLTITWEIEEGLLKLSGNNNQAHSMQNCHPVATNWYLVLTYFYLQQFFSRSMKPIGQELDNSVTEFNIKIYVLWIIKRTFFPKQHHSRIKRACVDVGHSWAQLFTDSKNINLSSNGSLRWEKNRTSSRKLRNVSPLRVDSECYAYKTPP